VVDVLESNAVINGQDPTHPFITDTLAVFIVVINLTFYSCFFLTLKLIIILKQGIKLVVNKRESGKCFNYFYKPCLIELSFSYHLKSPSSLH